MAVGLWGCGPKQNEFKCTEIINSQLIFKKICNLMPSKVLFISKLDY